MIMGWSGISSGKEIGSFLKVLKRDYLNHKWTSPEEAKEFIKRLLREKQES